MSEFDDLDEVFGVLRGPATPIELSAENDMVDLMVSNHRRTGGSKMFTSRRSRVAVLIAAGVIGFGGVAAAGPSALDVVGFGEDAPADTGDAPLVTEDEDDVAPETNETNETIDDTEDTEDTAETPDAETMPAADEPTDDLAAPEVASPGELGSYGDVIDPVKDTAFNEAYCVEGSHGKTVSAVARGEARFEGVSVVAAAQSNCGKKTEESTAIEDETEDDTDTEVDAADEEAEIEDETGEATGPSDRSGKEKPNNKGNGRPDAPPAKSSEGRGNSGKKGD